MEKRWKITGDFDVTTNIICSMYAVEAHVPLTPTVLPQRASLLAVARDSAGGVVRWWAYRDGGHATSQRGGDVRQQAVQCAAASHATPHRQGSVLSVLL